MIGKTIAELPSGRQRLPHDIADTLSRRVSRLAQAADFG